MSPKTRLGGKSYERIEKILNGEEEIVNRDISKGAKNGFFHLKRKMGTLSEREREVFQNVFLNELLAMTSSFQALIDIHQDRCHTLEQKVRLGVNYSNAACGF